MVTVKDLIKSFDGFIALNQLNLHIKKGSVYGLVGVNGAGKTTLIKHLAGVYRQDAGEVCIDGVPVFNNADIKERVGFIPDELYFFPQYNMRVLKKFYTRLYKNWNDQRYQQMQKMFGLDEKPGLNKFSKGMQKQAAFVFIMSIMPDVLLLDEPIDGLDPVVRRQVMQFVKEDVAGRQLTVLVSSHNLKEMEGICDAIGIIDGGKMTMERDVHDKTAEIHKIQVVLPDNTELDSIEGLTILHREKHASMEWLVMKGPEKEMTAYVNSLKPVVFDHLPLSLEEISLKTPHAKNLEKP